MAEKIDWNEEWKNYHKGAISIGRVCAEGTCEGISCCVKQIWITEEKYKRGLIDAQYECYVCHNKHMNFRTTFYEKANAHVSLCDKCSDEEFERWKNSRKYTNK